MSDFLSTLIARARGDAPGEGPASLIQPRPLARFEPASAAGWDALSLSVESGAEAPARPAPGDGPSLAPPAPQPQADIGPADQAAPEPPATQPPPRHAPQPAARERQPSELPVPAAAESAPAPLAAQPLTPQRPPAPPSGEEARPSRPPAAPGPAENPAPAPPRVQPAQTIVQQSERQTSLPAATAPPAEKTTRLEPALSAPPANGLQPALSPPPPTSAQPPAAGPEPVINVTIGRVEIRAVAAPPPPQRTPRTEPAVMSLEDYLRRRREKGGR